MKRTIFSVIAAISVFSIGITSCAIDPLTEEDVFKSEEDVMNMLQPNDKVYHLNDFVATFMTEMGNLVNDSTPYRTRSTKGNGIYLFSVDTIPTDTIGIYIRGRVSTDDYGGNFYKSIVIQEIVDGKQQNLRLSVDMGSANGLYQLGQEILIRCNGLSIGRYANQPQLCVPSYNNNIYANNASEKVGWAPGRIPSKVFEQATTLIGVPQPDSLVYDTISITDYLKKAVQCNDASMTFSREMDGRLVVLKDVHFTGEYENQGAFEPCTNGDPEYDTNANVFAPTTNNIGYPQSRVISDAADENKTLVSSSEFAKFARFYIPAEEYVGTVTGILGFYLDNAKYIDQMDGYEWSISVRNIKISENSGSNLNDIDLTNAAKEPWVPTEYKQPDKEDENEPTEPAQ